MTGDEVIGLTDPMDPHELAALLAELREVDPEAAAEIDVMVAAALEAARERARQDAEGGR